MGFMEAVRSVIIHRYVDFQGRSPRSEYWWFFLFNIILQIVIYVIALGSPEVGGIIGLVVGLGLFLPGLAVSIRRFHDLDKSGWWILIAFVPLIGFLLIIYWFCQRGTPGDNRFGPDPLGNVAARFD